jgi:hypothetical protein
VRAWTADDRVRRADGSIEENAVSITARKIFTLGHFRDIAAISSASALLWFRA